MRQDILRFGIFVFGTVTVASGIAAATSALVACENLKDVSVVPDGSRDDLDAGSPPVPTTPDETPVTPPPPSDPTPSGRVRLGNFLQSSNTVTICAKTAAAPNSAWAPIGVDEFGSSVGAGSVSSYTFLEVTAPTASYQYRIVPGNESCTGDDILAQSGSVTLRQNGGTTLAIVGEASGVDAGDANPRLIAVADNITPPAGATSLRAFHGVPDLAAFDVVINGETVLTGVKYGTAVGFPYSTSNTTGYASIPAGVPENARLTLRSGTTVSSFTFPQRLRRGLAFSLFVSGTRDATSVELCTDRNVAGETSSNCQTLPAAQ